MGIYANLVEFVAEIETTPTCALETREWFDLNAGAYARLDVVVDYKTLGLVPTVSTTLLSAPTLTQCWIPGKASGIAGPGLTMTAPPGLSMPASALPTVSSTALLATQSSSGRVTASGSSQIASFSSATIPTSTVSSAAVSSSSSTASITAKTATSSATKLSALSSAVPSLAPPLSLNGTGKYPMVQSSQVSVSGSQAASSSSSASSSVSGSQAASSSLSASSLPAAASVTAKYPSFPTTMAPPLSTGVPSVVVSPLSVNSIGRYPMLNASSLTNETNLVTTTLYSTSAYTITMCAAGVPNCPAAYQKEVAVTKTIDSYTTVCPAGAQVTWPAAAEVGSEAATSSTAAGPVTSHRVVTQVIAMTAVPSPKPETFVPPPVPAPTTAAVVAAAAVGGESGSEAAPPRPAAAAAYAAFMADYGVDNAGPRNATLSTPSSSSGSGSGHLGHPAAAADGAGQPGESAASLAESFKHKTIAQDTPASPAEEQHNVPVTAGGIVSYAENIGLVLGSVMVTVLLLG